MTDFAGHFTGVKPKKSYDPEVALSLAVACDLAYQGKTTVERIAQSWGYTKVTFIDVKKGRDIVPHVPPEPFFSHPGHRILLEYNKRETSKSKWTEMRKTMFEVLMKMTGSLERIRDIGDNHKLHTKNKGYIARLIRDASRERRKPKN
jgi:hypothetical protein